MSLHNLLNNRDTSRQVIYASDAVCLTVPKGPLAARNARELPAQRLHSSLRLVRGFRRRLKQVRRRLVPRGSIQLVFDDINNFEEYHVIRFCMLLRF